MSTTTIESGSGPAGAVFDPGESLAHGAVHLDVTDLPRALAFWRDLLGLTDLGEADGVARLGSGGRELIVLHAGAVRSPQRGHSGLYHVALHLPDEREFARVLARLGAARYPQAPTDHIFSKASYLDDPDGIGLELTLETPERITEMSVQGSELRIVDRDGRRRSPVEPLDTDEVFSHLGDEADLDVPLPDATKVGHVHLHVADLDVANAFYRDQIGFEEHTFLLIGMADLHTGGRFPHRLALNVWQGVGAPQPPPGTAGLRHFTIAARDAADLAAIRSRLEAAGTVLESDGDALFARDPAGNRFQLVA
ncbi:MAG TPA: VOC family protein [Solirubrobacterales bacterium]